MPLLLHLCSQGWVFFHMPAWSFFVCVCVCALTRTSFSALTGSFFCVCAAGSFRALGRSFFSERRPGWHAKEGLSQKGCAASTQPSPVCLRKYPQCFPHKWPGGRQVEGRLVKTKVRWGGEGWGQGG